MIDYLDQNKDVKLIYNEYVAEDLMTPFRLYPDMKNKYPIQVIELRFQVDHITPKKINCLKNIEITQMMLDYSLYYLDGEKKK